MTNELSVISLFTGGGGFDLGFASCDYNILFETDIDEMSCNTLQNNATIGVAHDLKGLKNTIVKRANAFDLKGTEILDLINLNKGDADILLGGPPCQAFSVFGKRAGIKDTRGQLSFEYTRLLSEISPKVFVFENVFGILTVEKGYLFKQLIATLSAPSPDLKYKLYWQRINAKNFGVPQSRDRVIIFGVREDVKHDPLMMQMRPITGNGLLPMRTVADGLKNMPSPTSDEGKQIPNHFGRKHSERIIDRYRALAPGERDSKTRINKLDLNLPSFTIIVGSDKGGGKGHVHPIEPREVTPRESSRMQTFPDWWCFQGSVRDIIRQVGNAVPPLLGASIANTVKEAVFNKKPTDFNTILKRLGQEHLFSS